MEGGASKLVRCGSLVLRFLRVLQPEWWQPLLRIGVSMILGGTIGFERELVSCSQRCSQQPTVVQMKMHVHQQGMAGLRCDCLFLIVMSYL